MLEFDYDPTLDGFPKPLDLLAMNEHSLPNLNCEEAAKLIGVEKYNPSEHLHLFIAAWRYKMAAAMLEARKRHL